MKTIEIAGHGLNIAAIIGVLGFAWPLLSEAMEYKETLVKAAATADKNEAVLSEVKVQSIEQSKDIERIAEQQKDIKEALDTIRMLLMERANERTE